MNHIEPIIFWVNIFTLDRIIREIHNPMTLEELAFSVQLGKDLSNYTTNPPHVNAGKQLRDVGFDIRKGDIIRYVWTKKGVKPLQLANLRDIDTEKYVEHLQSTMGQIIESFELDFDDIIGKPKQTVLQKYWV